MHLSDRSKEWRQFRHSTTAAIPWRFPPIPRSRRAAAPRAMTSCLHSAGMRLAGAAARPKQTDSHRAQTLEASNAAQCFPGSLSQLPTKTACFKPKVRAHRLSVGLIPLHWPIAAQSRSSAVSGAGESRHRVANALVGRPGETCFRTAAVWPAAPGGAPGPSAAPRGGPRRRPRSARWHWHRGHRGRHGRWRC
jgi:hypothetical protein